MQPPATRIDLLDGGWLDLWPGLVADDLDWLARLSAELPLGTERYRMMGREVAAPRLVSWHGDAGRDGRDGMGWHADAGRR